MTDISIAEAVAARLAHLLQPSTASNLVAILRDLEPPTPANDDDDGVSSSQGRQRATAALISAQAVDSFPRNEIHPETNDVVAQLALALLDGITRKACGAVVGDRVDLNDYNGVRRRYHAATRLPVLLDAFDAHQRLYLTSSSSSHPLMTTVGPLAQVLCAVLKYSFGAISASLASTVGSVHQPRTHRVRAALAFAIASSVSAAAVAAAGQEAPTMSRAYESLGRGLWHWHTAAAQDEAARATGDVPTVAVLLGDLEVAITSLSAAIAALQPHVYRPPPPRSPSSSSSSSFSRWLLSAAASNVLLPLAEASLEQAQALHAKVDTDNRTVYFQADATSARRPSVFAPPHVISASSAAADDETLLLSPPEVGDDEEERALQPARWVLEKRWAAGLDALKQPEMHRSWTDALRTALQPVHKQAAALQLTSRAARLADDCLRAAQHLVAPQSLPLFFHLAVRHGTLRRYLETTLDEARKVAEALGIRSGTLRAAEVPPAAKRNRAEVASRADAAVARLQDVEQSLSGFADRYRGVMRSGVAVLAADPGELLDAEGGPTDLGPVWWSLRQAAESIHTLLKNEGPSVTTTTAVDEQLERAMRNAEAFVRKAHSIPSPLSYDLVRSSTAFYAEADAVLAGIRDAHRDALQAANEAALYVEEDMALVQRASQLVAVQREGSAPALQPAASSSGGDAAPRANVAVDEEEETAFNERVAARAAALASVGHRRPRTAAESSPPATPTVTVTTAGGPQNEAADERRRPPTSPLQTSLVGATASALRSAATALLSPFRRATPTPTHGRSHTPPPPHWMQLAEEEAFQQRQQQDDEQRHNGGTTPSTIITTAPPASSASPRVSNRLEAALDSLDDNQS